MDFNNLPPLLTRLQVQELLQIKNSTFSKWKRANIFGDPVLFGPTRYRYSKDNILSLMETGFEKLPEESENQRPKRKLKEKPAVDGSNPHDDGGSKPRKK
jgi:hypothetical protein